MKKLLVLLLCVPLLFSCGEKGNKENKEIENDLTRANIKGNVKEIRETSFVRYESLGAEEKHMFYNQDGNLTEIISCNANGELCRRNKYQYDENRNLTQETFYNEDGEIDAKDKYQYDENGNIAEQTSYHSDGKIDSKTKRQYEYDNLKNWIVKIDYEDDKIIRISEREIEYYE